LYCAIVERYVREYKVLPEKGVVYFNVNIGNWLTAQQELSSLGLLPSSHQTRINALEILLAEMNPTSLGDLLDFGRGTRPSKPAPKPVPKVRIRPRPLTPVPPVAKTAETEPAVDLDAVTRDTEDVSVVHDAPVDNLPAPEIADPVVVGETDHVDPPAVEDTPVEVEDTAVIDDPAVEETDDVTDTPAVDEVEPATTEDVAESPEPVTEDTPEPEPVVESAAEPVTTEDEEEAPEPATEDTTEDERSEFELRVAAVTEFYNLHHRLPKRPDAHVRAGGVSLTWWTWGLVPAYAEGKIGPEELDTLAVEPWWSDIVERAVKLRAKRAAKDAEDGAAEPSTEDAAPTDEASATEETDPVPSDTSTDPAPADATVNAKTEEEPAPLTKIRDADAAARRKRTVPHRRNTLAAESRRDKEAAKAAADAEVRMADLPEAGLVALVTFDSDKSADHILAYRDVNPDALARSVRNLALGHIPYRASRIFRNDTSDLFRITVALRVTSVLDALPPLATLGYTVTEVSSSPLVP